MKTKAELLNRVAELEWRETQVVDALRRWHRNHVRAEVEHRDDQRMRYAHQLGIATGNFQNLVEALGLDMSLDDHSKAEG